MRNYSELVNRDVEDFLLVTNDLQMIMDVFMVVAHMVRFIRNEDWVLVESIDDVIVGGKDITTASIHVFVRIAIG